VDNVPGNAGCFIIGIFIVEMIAMMFEKCDMRKIGENGKKNSSFDSMRKLAAKQWAC